MCLPSSCRFRLSELFSRAAFSHSCLIWTREPPCTAPVPVGFLFAGLRLPARDWVPVRQPPEGHPGPVLLTERLRNSERWLTLSEDVMMRGEAGETRGSCSFSSTAGSSVAHQWLVFEPGPSGTRKYREPRSDSAVLGFGCLHFPLGSLGLFRLS